MKTTIQNYSVIAKGEYSHKQTNEFLHIERFLIVRRKKRRFLLLDANNLANETLTAIKLQIEQLDSRGNFLGETTDEVKKTSFKKGKFILKRAIELAHNCVDVRVKVIYAEYGNYVYRLGDEGTYVTYEKAKKWRKLDEATVQMKTGEEGIKTSFRAFKMPAFVGFFVALVLIAAAIIGVLHVQDFRKTASSQEFFLNNLKYRYVDGNEYDGAPVYVTGHIGAGGEKIHIPAEVDGHPVVKVERDAFAYNNVVKEVTVTRGVEVDSRAFYNCNTLRKVTLLGNNDIGDYAFSDCYSLRTIQIYDATTIGKEAFANVGNLETLKIEGNGEGYDVVEIGDLAFSGINWLQELRINAYVDYDSAFTPFHSLSNIEKLYLKNYNYSEIEGNDTEKKLSELFSYNSGYYGWINVREVEIEYMDGIPDYFLQGCSSAIQTIKMHYLESTEVGECAFEGCNALKTVETPQKITGLGANAFARSGITFFDATELTSWDRDVFNGCTQLQAIEFGEDSPLKTIPQRAFMDCTALQVFEFPQNVEVIEESAFNGCKGLTSVRLPSSVTTLEDLAFAYCEKMEKVYLPELLFQIGNSAFGGCIKLHEVYNFSALNLLKGSTEYGEVAYNALAIHDNVDNSLPVTEVNGFIFKNNGNDWALVDYVGDAREIVLGTMYTNGKALTSYRVVRYAFDEGNYTIDKVTIGNAVVDMLDRSFYNLPNLRLVDCGGVNFSFKENVFDHCYSLTSIIVPTSLPKMTGYAFGSSYNAIVYYEGEEKDWNKNEECYLFNSYNRFYFNKCVHEYGQWNYDRNKNINTSRVEYQQVITKNPTCTKDGDCEYHCPNCEYYYEDIMPKLGHLYDNSECKRCGYVNNLFVNRDSMEQAKKLLQFDVDGFDIFGTSYRMIHASMEKGATSKLTITAKKDVSIRFDAGIIKGADCEVTIVVNGKKQTLEAESKNYYFELKVGDTIEITCRDNREEDSSESDTIADTKLSYPMWIEYIYVSSLHEPV